ncbi:hypothetical protein [Acidothermus cellulolyticus]|uniref:hypothetical protein n=1 Tax=Acidothermus cellulolyticus TaxID=28049 RepID=UPI0005A17E4B|nr:hypothetical protein [Acidothermus cellulolyticus]
MSMTDEVTEALEETADVARKTAAHQQEIAELADEARTAHAHGASWTAPHQARQLRLILAMLTTCISQLSRVLAHLRRSWARALLAEGLSLRHIARIFGVSHQRIAAILRHRHAPALFGGNRSTTGEDDESESADEYRERGNVE